MRNLSDGIFEVSSGYFPNEDVLLLSSVKDFIKELKKEILKIEGEIYIQATDKIGIFDIIDKLTGDQFILSESSEVKNGN